MVSITEDIVGTLERLDTGQNYNDFEDWFCLKHKPRWCWSCEIEVGFMHYERKIVIWPEKDHPELLSIAAKGMEYYPDQDFRIVQYEQNFGPCIEFDKVE